MTQRQEGMLQRAKGFVVRHRKAVVSFAVTVAILSLVILVGGALQARTESGESGDAVGLLPKQQEPAELIEARKAIESGEVTRALVELDAYLRKNPNDSEAQKLRDTLKPAPAIDDSDDPPNGSPDEYLNGKTDLSALLPAAVPGYTVDNLDKGSEQAALTITPTKGAAQDGAVRVVLMTVYDFGTPAKAAAFVAGQTKAFPVSDQPLSVGVSDGRLGADASRIAAVSFSRGRFAFEVVLTAEKPDALRLKSHLLELVGYFPAAS